MTAMMQLCFIESILKIYMSEVSGGSPVRKNLNAFDAETSAALDQLRAMKAKLAVAADPYGNHKRIIAVIDLGIATYAVWNQWARTGAILEDA